MRTMRRAWAAACAVLVLLLVTLLDTSVSAQQVNLDQAVKAIVRIRGCNAAGCNVGLGSGVIIHPGGVILTANHVTLSDANNPLSPRLDDFVIEMTENARQAPVARYRARLVAAKPESDLALLHVYWDEAANRAFDDSTPVRLPSLPIADVSTVALGERLYILGYPLAGGKAINYTEAALGGFDQGGALFKANVSLNEGYSGGPTLIVRHGGYQIVGVVVLRRADVSYMRSVEQLDTMAWEPAARRVWVDSVRVTMQETGAGAVLQIRAEIQALDFANRKGCLLAYAYDSTTLQPWLPTDGKSPWRTEGNVSRAPNGQLILRSDFSISGFVEIGSSVGMNAPWRELGGDPQRLLFRLVLWDAQAAQALWRDAEWYQALPFGTPYPVQVPPVTPIPTITPVPTDTSTPTYTATPIPTPDFEQHIATAVAATLAARPNLGPTPTATPVPPPTPTVPAPAPTATMDAGPTVYDNFDNPAYDGGYNSALWSFYTQNSTGRIFQEDGVLVLSRDAVRDGKTGIWRDVGLSARRYDRTRLEDDQFFEVKWKVSGPQDGEIALHVNLGQYTICCVLGYGDAQHATSFCVFLKPTDPSQPLFTTQPKQVDYGAWHTARIEVDAATMKQTFSLDGQVVGTHLPENAEALRGYAINYGINVGSGSAAPVAGYMDYVRIGHPPAPQPGK